MRAVRQWIVAATGTALFASVAVTTCAKRAAPPPPPPEPPKIAAASDLAFAFKEVGEAYARQTGVSPAFVYGSSGDLANQIEQGAHFDVFASSSREFTQRVAYAGWCEATTQVLYGRGRLVVWTRHRGVVPPSTVDELKDARFKKIAIADPELAPYGKAAQEALTHAGVWDAIRDRIIYGENGERTFKLAETGDADVAVTALSLAKSGASGNYFLVDASLHRPINHTLIACKHGDSPVQGRRFVVFLNGDEGRAIMQKYGFLLPGEPEPEL